MVTTKKIKLPNGDTFEGVLKNGKPEGKGKLWTKGGSFYEGNFKNGEFDGKGKIEYDDGDIYEGDWKNGERHGKGKMKYHDGYIYKGDWKNGDMDGKGIMYYNKVSKSNINYEGEWEKNEKHGLGKMPERFLLRDFKTEEIATYEGNFYHGKRIGEGQYTFESGTTIKGEWEENVDDGKAFFRGFGIIYSTNGDFYKGNVLKYDGIGNLRLEGNGRMVYNNGDVYEGEWKGASPFGYGKMQYSNGNVYEGGWGVGEYGFDDGYLGKGKLIIKDRFTLDGNWYINNNPDPDNLYSEKGGNGKIIYKNGKVYEGSWKETNEGNIGEEQHREIEGERGYIDDVEDYALSDPGCYVENEIFNRRNDINNKIYESNHKKLITIESIMLMHPKEILDSIDDFNFGPGFTYHDFSWIPYDKNGKYENEGTILDKLKYLSKSQENGIPKYEEGDIYYGDIYEGFPHGLGIIFYKNGDLFIGNFKNGIRNGWGKSYSSYFGIIYEGNFNGNEISGRGKLTWNDGSYFEGDYKEIKDVVSVNIRNIFDYPKRGDGVDIPVMRVREFKEDFNGNTLKYINIGGIKFYNITSNSHKEIKNTFRNLGSFFFYDCNALHGAILGNLQISNNNDEYCYAKLYRKSSIIEGLFELKGLFDGPILQQGTCVILGEGERPGDMLWNGVWQEDGIKIKKGGMYFIGDEYDEVLFEGEMFRKDSGVEFEGIKYFAYNKGSFINTKTGHTGFDRNFGIKSEYYLSLYNRVLNGSRIEKDSLKVFFFDTETTGQNINLDDQILQFSGILGTITKEGFKKERTINQYINVSKDISEGAYNIHKISKGFLQDFGYFQDYADEIEFFFRDIDLIVGHNIKFDLTMIKQEMKRIGKDFNIESIGTYDTMLGTTHLLCLKGQYGYKWPKLSELYYFLFNKNFENAHDSMSDIEATKDCFVKLIETKWIPIGNQANCGYDSDGYNADGFDFNGYDEDGYDIDGFKKDGYDKRGYDKDGYNRKGYDKDGYYRDGYNVDGFNRLGINKNTGTKYNEDGYDIDGYDKDGFDESGENEEGYYRDGYNKYGFDKDGFDRDGYDKKGYNKKGYNRDGYNKYGFDKDGYQKDLTSKKGFYRNSVHVFNKYDKNGFDKNGIHRDTGTKYDRNGFMRNGYNKYTKGPFDKNGLDIEGKKFN